MENAESLVALLKVHPVLLVNPVNPVTMVHLAFPVRTDLLDETDNPVSLVLLEHLVLWALKDLLANLDLMVNLAVLAPKETPVCVYAFLGMQFYAFIGICPKYCALDGGVFFEDGTRRR